MNFANYFMNFSVAVKSLFLPKVMHMETDGANSEQYTLFMIKTGRMQGYLLFYLYFAFLFYGRQFIKIIMGKDYFEAWLSGLFVMTGLIIPLLQNAGHPILQAKNKHHIYVIVCLLISIVNATSTWLVVESRGIVGAAFMTMLSFILGQAVFLSWYYSKKIGIQMSRFYLEIIRANILPIIGVIILEMIIVKFTVIDTWTNFIVQCIVYTLMYGISILNWGMNREEKEFLFGFIKRRKLVKQHE
jgi:O-antigen/teichoic acid export membrane protein